MRHKRRMVSVPSACGFEGGGFVTLRRLGPGDQPPVLSLPWEAASSQSSEGSPYLQLEPLLKLQRWQVGDAESKLCWERSWVVSAVARLSASCISVCSALVFLCDHLVFFFLYCQLNPRLYACSAQVPRCVEGFLLCFSFLPLFRSLRLLLIILQVKIVFLYYL